MNDILDPDDVALYQKIQSEIARCNALDPLAVVSSPMFGTPSSDRADMLWRPKAVLTGLLHEEVGDDEVIAIDRVTLRARNMVVKFELKKSSDSPIRCVVILNGRYSIRISIGRGKVKGRRTYAEMLIEIDPNLTERRKRVYVEICTENTLLFYAQLVSRPQSLKQWLLHAISTSLEVLHIPFPRPRFRAVRVEAMRLLEDSFRLKAR